MASIINASPTNGIVQTADGSGVLKCQANGVTTNALAWVNFNGTGTVAIRSAYNVSSITDNGTGDYTVNFTNALTDANYAPTISMSGTYGSNGVPMNAYMNSATSSATETAPTTTALRFTTWTQTVTISDMKYINVAVFGN